MWSSGRASGAVVAVILLGWAAAAPAATIPFSSNFDSDTVGATSATGFTGGGSSIYTIVQQAVGDNALQAASSVNSGSQGVSLTNAAGNPVSLTSDVRLVSLVNGGTGAAANFGFGMYGDTANFSSGSQYRILVNTLGTGAGKPFLVRNGTNVTTSDTGTAVAIANGSDYTLTATATPVGGTLVLSASVTDGTNTYTINYTDSSPLTGTFFGYRTATAGTGTSETVQYDNFAATFVPEPGTLGVVALASLFLTRRFRWRRHS